jgi:hypothetical protein
MNENETQRMQELLKSAVPRADAELGRDLWPEMLARIRTGESRGIRFAALDWVIAGLVAASIFFFPGLLPGLVYHL